MGGDPSADGADPLYLYRQMGMLSPRPRDEELIDVAYRLQRLEQQLADATDRAGSLGRREGASTVVRAAMKTGEWAVAVWPVVEGTPDCPLRVADRIDIRRTDGKPATADDVWQDPTLKAALRASYAVPASRSPRWSTEPGVAHWSITHVGSPRSPLVQLHHPGTASVICLALTLDSWVNDVASLLATVLGYGLTLTRDLAMETYGLRAGHTTSHHRQIAYETVRDRLPESRVLSHYARLGTPPRSPFISPSHQWDKDVIYVWLREGDDVLQEWVDRGYPEVTLEHLITHRLALDDFATRVPNPAQVITLDISRQAGPTAKWQQVLECVSSALTQMVDRGFLTTDLAFVHTKAQQDDPSIAVPLLRWLRKDGCAAVID
jgi:hypothetical protein